MAEIIRNIGMDEYLSWPDFDHTFLWELYNRSPMHAKHSREHPEDRSSAAKELGTLVHTALLEPEKFKAVQIMPANPPRRPTPAQRSAKSPSESTVNSIEFWDEWDAKAEAGEMILHAEDHAHIQAVVKTVERMQCHKLIAAGEPEVCVKWTDDATGLPLKARLDYVRQALGDTITDLKTSRNAQREAFLRDAASYGYHHQVAAYKTAWLAAAGSSPDFVWLVVEPEPPHGISAIRPTTRTIQAGAAAWRRSLDICAECIKKDEWPGYPDFILDGEIPEWALRKEGVE